MLVIYILPSKQEATFHKILQNDWTVLYHEDIKQYKHTVVRMDTIQNSTLIQGLFSQFC